MNIIIFITTITIIITITINRNNRSNNRKSDDDLDFVSSSSGYDGSLDIGEDNDEIITSKDDGDLEYYTKVRDLFIHLYIFLHPSVIPFLSIYFTYAYREELL
jgi:hypothetical protein